MVNVQQSPIQPSAAAWRERAEKAAHDLRALQDLAEAILHWDAATPEQLRAPRMFGMASGRFEAKREPTALQQDVVRRRIELLMQVLAR